MKKKLFNLIPFFIGLFILVIIYHEWFLSNSILTYSDWVFLFPSTIDSIPLLPSAWLDDQLGQSNIFLYFYPINFLIFSLNKTGMSFNIIQRIIFMVFPLIISFVGIYLLSNYIFNNKNKWASLISSFVYLFNTYVLFGQNSHLTIISALSLIPIFLYFLIRGVSDKNHKYLLISSLIGFVISAYEFRIFYIVCGIVFLYFIKTIYFNKIDIKFIFKNLFLHFYPLIIIFLINGYWIFRLFSQKSLTSNQFLDRGLFGNGYMSLSRAIALFHPFWTGGYPSAFISQSIPIHFWLIPLIAFIGFVVSRKNKNILFFGLISIIGIFLTKQSDHPFPGLYLWMFNHVPGFNAFRESSKFYLLIALGYSILIGSFFDWLSTKWNSLFRTKFLIIIMFLLAMSMFLFNTRSIISGEFGGLSVPRKIPKDYLIVNKFIKNQNEYFRTLWIPRKSRWTFYTQKHPKISFDEIIINEWSEFITLEKNIDSKKFVFDSMKSLGNDKGNILMDMSSIKYVVLPINDIVNDDAFYKYYNPRLLFENELNNFNYLEPVDLNTEELTVYENKNYRPHVYISESEILENFVNKYENTKYEKLSSNQYLLDINSSSNPFYVYLSEQFDKGWKVRIGEFNWFSSIFEKNYFLPDEIHSKNTSKLNTFFIDPKIVCSKYDCIKNEDGSFKIKTTLYFEPQSKMIVGFIFSTAIGFGVFIYLFFLYFYKIIMRDK